MSDRVTISVVALALLCGMAPQAAAAELCEQALAVTSPCEGVLLPPEVALQGLACLQVELPKEKALRLKVEQLRELDATYWSERYAVQEEYTTQLEKEYEALRAWTTRSGSWYQEPWVWVTVGAVAGGVAASGVAYLVTR